ncbi:MAG: hypothetical protein ACXQTD_02405 [Candidatus Syntropharchaeia archaeon]
MEIKMEIPLEGVINFYLALERFERYCEMCRRFKDEDQRLLYSSNAREDLDTAYTEYLSNIPLIFAMKEGIKPIVIFIEIETNELKKHFEEQLKCIEKNEMVKKYLECLNAMRNSCPGNCDYEKIKEKAEELKNLAKELKESVERLYTEDLMEYAKKQLREMVKDPEKFRNLFMLPPKPLIDEYRI